MPGFVKNINKKLLTIVTLFLILLPIVLIQAYKTHPVRADGSNGDIGVFSTTNQGQLPQNLYSHTTVTATIGGTSYIYVLGGDNAGGGIQSAVYRATIDSSGNIGTFDTTNQA